MSKHYPVTWGKTEKNFRSSAYVTVVAIKCFYKFQKTNCIQTFGHKISVEFYNEENRLNYFKHQNKAGKIQHNFNIFSSLHVSILTLSVLSAHYLI